MPIKPPPKFTAWSYSRLGDYEQCPLRAKLKHIDRIKEPGSAAMDRGAKIHEQAAQYMRGELSKLPTELGLFKKEFNQARKHAETLIIEEQWALTSAWQPCGWFDSTAWLRMVLDLAYQPARGLLRIIDYKTGRVRGVEQKPQLSLYALGGFLLIPDLLRVEVELWYLDHGEVVRDTFLHSTIGELKKQWQKKSRPLFADKIFAPRPGDKCRWCHYGQGKAGLCKF